MSGKLLFASVFRYARDYWKSSKLPHIVCTLIFCHSKYKLTLFEARVEKLYCQIIQDMDGPKYRSWTGEVPVI